MLPASLRASVRAYAQRRGCQHCEPADTCPICHPHTSPLDDARVEIAILLLLVIALSVFSVGSAWERELTFDDAHAARPLLYR